jgi:hypothetical protein
MNTFDLKKLIFQSVLFAALMIISLSILAQDKKETKQERKERQKQEQKKVFEKAKASMYDTAFVVPAESVQIRGGRMMLVSKTINFLQLIGTEGVVQIGSDFASQPGFNNLGGVTLKGPISNIKISEKKERIFMTFTITDVIGIVRVAVTINGSNKAVVDVEGMFSGKAFTMRGNLIDFKDAGIYEGFSY